MIEWVSTHRKHYRFSDLPGDPHSPHTDHGTGWRGAVRGLHDHAFPTSAHHGLAHRQLDPGGWLIDGLERLGLAWDVVRITPSAQRAKLAAGGRS